ncbi:phospholipase A1 member A-like [Argiope bruennichi]|uniref:Phospholipase A1 member A like protein n=1 Tax=Argiope bruennichi TaxID=94029 RepID=A0A8T0F5N2_ARGBR|nr:phospholipase A1 member A-like [Argiope bruennichi]KAF8786161.1 Phospholipase A1 member A like protein [Argiope bruennichi]
MTIRSLGIVLFVAVGEVVLFQGAGAEIISTIATDIVDIFVVLFEFVKGIVTNIIQETLNPPKNRNSSIQYLLYTPKNSNETCYMEPNLRALKQCPFNSTYPMKFLIHGFHASLGNKSLYWQMKDRMLELYEYNVIVVNWTDYNQPPYFLACLNTVAVGRDLADFIHFLQNNTGIEAKDIHLIGHSLGAHVAGIAGRRISSLGRITALDAAGFLYYPVQLFPALTNKDANFVDVIHTSNLTSGYGISVPIGDIDFYPNGGTKQPQCQTLGANYTGSKSLYTGSCNHKASVTYFLESINTTECVFLSTLCYNYTDFLDGFCTNDSSPVAEMGLPAKPILGLDPKSKFYLRTRVYKPYCIEDGYEPN